MCGCVAFTLHIPSSSSSRQWFSVGIAVSMVLLDSLFAWLFAKANAWQYVHQTSLLFRQLVLGRDKDIRAMMLRYVSEVHALSGVAAAHMGSPATNSSGVARETHDGHSALLSLSVLAQSPSALAPRPRRHTARRQAPTVDRCFRALDAMSPVSNGKDVFFLALDSPLELEMQQQSASDEVDACFDRLDSMQPVSNEQDVFFFANPVLADEREMGYPPATPESAARDHNDGRHLIPVHLPRDSSSPQSHPAHSQACSEPVVISSPTRPGNSKALAFALPPLDLPPSPTAAASMISPRTNSVRLCSR